MLKVEKLERHQILIITPRTLRINRPHGPGARDSAGIRLHANREGGVPWVRSPDRLILDQGSELFRPRYLCMLKVEKLKRHQILSMTPRTLRINRPHSPGARDSAGICVHAEGA